VATEQKEDKSEQRMLYGFMGSSLLLFLPFTSMFSSSHPPFVLSPPTHSGPPLFEQTGVPGDDFLHEEGMAFLQSTLTSRISPRLFPHLHPFSPHPRSPKENGQSSFRLVNVLISDHFRELAYPQILDSGRKGKTFWRRVQGNFALTPNLQFDTVQFRKDDKIIAAATAPIDLSHVVHYGWEELRGIWRTLNEKYNEALQKYADYESGASERNFYEFCLGQGDTYYLRKSLLSRYPQLANPTLAHSPPGSSESAMVLPEQNGEGNNEDDVDGAYNVVPPLPNLLALGSSSSPVSSCADVFPTPTTPLLAESMDSMVASGDATRINPSAEEIDMARMEGQLTFRTLGFIGGLAMIVSNGLGALDRFLSFHFSGSLISTYGVLFGVLSKYQGHTILMNCKRNYFCKEKPSISMQSSCWKCQQPYGA